MWRLRHSADSSVYMWLPCSVWSVSQFFLHFEITLKTVIRTTTRSFYTLVSWSNLILAGEGDSILVAANLLLLLCFNFYPLFLFNYIYWSYFCFHMSLDGEHSLLPSDSASAASISSAEGTQWRLISASSKKQQEETIANITIDNFTSLVSLMQHQLVMSEERWKSDNQTLLFFTSISWSYYGR